MNFFVGNTEYILTFAKKQRFFLTNFSQKNSQQSLFKSFTKKAIFTQKMMEL